MRIAIPMALLLLSAFACSNWRTQNLPAPQVVAAQKGGTVRLLRRDHSVLLLSDPQVAGDSIVGLAGKPPVRAAVAVADVERVDVRRLSATRTGGLAVGTTVLVTIIAVGAAMAAVLGGWN